MPFGIKKPRWRLGVAAACLACLLGAAACSEGTDRKAERPPAPVTTTQTVQRDAPVRVKAIGQVEALSTVSVTAQVGGQLQKVHFGEGQEVSLGQRLFTIDPRPFQAALDQALANLAKDQALLKEYAQEAARNKDLVKRDFVSQQDYDQIVSKVDSQAAVVKAGEAAVEKARLDLSYCFIHSPLAGRAGALLLHEGNVVSTGPDHPLVVIKQTHPCYVRFAVPERELERIQKRQTAEGPLKASAAPPDSQGPPEQGRLSFIDNQVDKETGAINLKATFANPAGRLWPGQFVNVILTLYQLPHAVIAPGRAIQTGPQGLFVFVVGKDGTVAMRPVQVGEVLDDDVVVDKGLKPGERVVTDGQLSLYPGAKAVEAKPAGGGEGNEARPEGAAASQDGKRAGEKAP